MLYIIPTSAAEHLGKRIDEEIKKRNLTNTRVIFPRKNQDGQRYFPDEEVYSSLPQAEQGLFNNQHIIILHSGQPKPNAGIRELEYILEIIQHYSSPQKIDLFFAYIPYGRQDQRFLPGEIAKIEKDFDKLYGWYKINQIYIIDAHFAQREHWDYQKRPFINIKGYEILIEKIKKDFLGKEILFLAPDLGAQLRSSLSGAQKERRDSYTVEIKSEEDLIKQIKTHSHITALDDFSETGGTMVKFRDFCKKHNPPCTLIAALTHGVKQKGIDRTREAYDFFYLGNTIDRKEANLDFTELIMKSLGIL